MLLRNALHEVRALSLAPIERSTARPSRSEWAASLDLQRAALAPLESDTGEKRLPRSFAFTIDLDAIG
jgi:hypothetical protein